MTIKISDADFINAWGKGSGSPTLVAKITGLTTRGVYSRRNEVEKRLGISLETNPLPTCPNGGYRLHHYETSRAVTMQNGCGIVFSDAHFWPRQATTLAYRALLTLAKELQPRLVIANGDVTDLPGLSTHGAVGWANLPSLEDELTEVQIRMAEIRDACPEALKLRTIGNHDHRFDRRLAERAPDLRGVMGSRLSDHIPDWPESWKVTINDDIVVKHRWHQGVHATFNNTVKSGVSIITGHMHRLMATPWADYTGRRWGVDTGTLADPDAPQFGYDEGNPKPWASGFVVLTWHNGQMLTPEFCEVFGGAAYFRGVKL